MFVDLRESSEKREGGECGPVWVSFTGNCGGERLG